jgi:hypothetical protein
MNSSREKEINIPEMKKHLIINQGKQNEMSKWVKNQTWTKIKKREKMFIITLFLSIILTFKTTTPNKFTYTFAKPTLPSEIPNFEISFIKDNYPGTLRKIETGWVIKYGKQAMFGLITPNCSSFITGLK